VQPPIIELSQEHSGETSMSRGRVGMTDTWQEAGCGYAALLVLTRRYSTAVSSDVDFALFSAATSRAALAFYLWRGVSLVGEMTFTELATTTSQLFLVSIINWYSFFWIHYHSIQLPSKLNYISLASQTGACHQSLALSF
jgi:hypothetical protein